MQVTSTRRLNPLTGDFVLVSPIRISRPWTQETKQIEEAPQLKYDSSCYLCPNNTRLNGSVNPDYKGVYVFENDFPSFVKSKTKTSFTKNNELFSETEETGICEVVCYSPNHNLNFTNMEVSDICRVIKTWIDRYDWLSKQKDINHIQIFETRGKEVGNSVSHPHCQIWSQKSIPSLPQKIYLNQEKYGNKHNSKLLLEYVLQERKHKQRILIELGDFVLLVPFWAEWPYETYILPKIDIDSLIKLTEKQIQDLAELLSLTAKMYAYFFKRPNLGAPYMMSVYQNPTTESKLRHNQLFFRFICPLLTPIRSKYQAGYEKSAESQRDITPEHAAQELRDVITKIHKHLA